MHQALAPSGDVEEDLVEPAAQGDLVHRGLDGGALHLGEGAPDLADLVVAVLQRRRLPGDVDLLAAAQPGHHVGSRCSASSSAAVRTPLSRRTRVRPTRSATSTETTTATSPSTPAAASRTRMRTAIGTERSVRPSASASSKSRNCCCTVSWLACQVAASTGGRPDRSGTTSASCMVRSRVNASLSVNRWYATRLALGQVGDGALGEPPLVADGLYELGVLALGEPPGGQRAGQQRVALAEQLPGAAQRGERQGLPVEVRVGQGRHPGERLEGRGDHAAVQADRAGPVHLAVVDEVPPAGQRRQGGDQLVDAGVQQVVGGVAQRFPVDPAAQFGDRPIGACRCSARAGSSVVPASCTTESRRSRCNSVTTASPGRPRSYSRVRAESRFRAGPKVSVVAKIHSASSAVTGATTNAVSFERIGQSRVFIRPRPYRVAGGAGTAGHRACRLRARPRRRAPARAPWAGYVIEAVSLPPVSTRPSAASRDESGLGR